MTAKNLSDKYEKILGHSLRYVASTDNGVKSKPGVLFFHGYSFSLDNWKDTGAINRVIWAGYPVLVPDLPSGKSSKSDKNRLSESE